MSERVLIIANPTAGVGAGRINKPRLIDVARRDIERGRDEKAALQAEVAFETTPENVVQRAARASADGFSIVVAAGGDGTVNAVASGLLQARAESGAAVENAPILGVLPMGTGNVFAFNLGIERGLRAACRVIRHGHVRTIDVGTARTISTPNAAQNQDATSRYFLLMAGVGFDAKVVEDTSLRLKFVLRDFAYALKALQNSITNRGTTMRLRFDDGREYSNPAWLLMVGNAASYAWDIRLTSRAKLDDGLVDICLFPYQSKVLAVRQVLQVLTGHHIESGDVEYWKTSGVTIESDEPVPVQLDGDEWARTPIRIGVLPGALRVLAPRFPDNAA